MSVAAIPRPTAMRPRIFTARAIPSSRATILPKAGAGAAAMRFSSISATMSHHRMGLSRGIIEEGSNPTESQSRTAVLRIAFSGGADYLDAKLIWAVLDKVHAKHPDMVLLHGGSPNGAELIAAK